MFTNAFLTILIFIVCTLPGYAAEKGNFIPPSLDGYSFNARWDIDWDEDGRIDTTIKNYKNAQLDSISKVYKKGTEIIWVWSIDTNGDDDSNITNNYNLVDTDNDGKFDTRYDMKEDIPLPGWVK